jgi:hypothetical protein
MTMPGLLRAAMAAAGTAVAVIACVPVWSIPSGYAGSSRQNIGEGLPDFVVEGKTTREEVLLRLGEPDVRGPADSWFGYGSLLNAGGVDFGLVSAQTLRYRRIILGFDEQGVVTRATYVERGCVIYNEGPSKDAACKAIASDEASEWLRERFLGAVYRSGDRWVAGATVVTSQAVVFLAGPDEKSVYRQLLRLHGSEIANVEWGADDPLQGGPTAVILHPDGTREVFAFGPLQHAGAFDRVRTERFIEYVRLMHTPAR